MGKLLIALMLLGCARSVQAAEEWRWQKPNMAETIVHVAAESLLLADMLQTFDIKNHRGMTESNFILGPRPSDGVIVGYFAAIMIVTTMIWYVTPQIGRYFIDCPIFYFELPIVVNNHEHFGLRFKLPF